MRNHPTITATFHSRRFPIALVFALTGIFLPLTVAADTDGKIGIVIMHGKGGRPDGSVAGLASGLAQQGFLVANLDMPWSARRDYDVDVSAAEKEVESALTALRDKGAAKLFVAGHSMGGAFALYLGTKHAVNGIIAIAPGGDVGNATFQDKLGDTVALARKLVAEGKGHEKTRLSDFEGAKGVTPIVTTPAVYLTWFDPEGAMNQAKAVKGMNPDVPVLYIAPTDDYPGLRRVKQTMFGALPKNPRTKLYQPNAKHLQAPSASIEEIAAWTTAVAGAK